MTITKVKYEKLFPTGAYLNEKIGFEAELGSHGGFANGVDSSQGYIDIPDDPIKGIEYLRQLTEQSHKAKYPHLYIDNQPINIEQSEPDEKPPSKEQGLIQVIQLCTTTAALERFRKEVERVDNMEVWKAFHDKGEKLINT